VDPGDYDTSQIGEEVDREAGLRGALRHSEDADGTPAFTPLTALTIMIFFALCSQCVATLGAIKRETRSWRWPVFTFTYMTALAWIVAVAVYQIGSALGLGTGVS
jgi:ferrous iron transport protein B